jgi:hypothetical protein
MYSVEKSAPLHIKYGTLYRYFAELLRKILPVYKFWRICAFLFTFSIIAQTNYRFGT